MDAPNPLEDPRIASTVFFPRPDLPFGPEAPGARDHLFAAAPGVESRLRIFPGPAAAPTILFFHGNGETGRDYDGSAPSYNALPATLIVAEYRGYGPCGGTPALDNFLKDAHASLDETCRLLATEERAGRIVVMGRSLGSAPAIELASTRERELVGLIVESGFALLVPLLELLGIPTATLGITEQHGPRNYEKLGQVTLPTLIMHAEQDEIIPLEDGAALHEAAADPGKRLLSVAGAGHNDIQLVAGPSYFEAIGELLARL